MRSPQVESDTGRPDPAAVPEPPADGGARRPGALLLAAAYCVFVLGYVVANPPGMAPDEPAHFYRAAGLANGDLTGRPATFLRLDVPPRQLPWLNRTSRSVRVGDRYTGCDPFHLPLAGRCPLDRSANRLRAPEPPGRTVTYVGTYPPLPYLLPAVAIRLAAALGLSLFPTVVLARLASAVSCVALLLVAARLLWRRGRPPTVLVAAALAVTPPVLFFSGSLGGSGLEICAALCLAAALLQSTSGAGQRPAWPTAGVAAVVLALSRSTGGGWVLVLSVLVLLVRGGATVRSAFRRRPAAATWALVAGVAGIGASLAWSVLVEPQRAVSARTLIAGLLPSVRALPDVVKQTVGALGWVDVSLPLEQSAMWLLLLVGVMVLAGRSSGHRGRRVVAIAVAAYLAVTVVLADAVIRPTSPDFRMQGRYVLPLAVVLPVLAASLRAGGVGRDTGLAWLDRPDRRATVFALVLGFALQAQAVAVMVNITHYQHALSLRDVYGVADWSPPGRPLGWAFVVTVATACGAVGMWRAAHSPEHRPAGGAAVPGAAGRPGDAGVAG